MSEPGGTEETSFPGDPGPVPEADAPRQFTPSERAAAREQLLAQGELAPAAPVPDSASLGIQALAAGAQADEVDPGELLRMLQAQQARIDALESEKRLATAPDIVKYATALADHLQVKADANPVIHSDPDHTWMPALELAAGLVNAASTAAQSGQPGDLAAQVAKVRTWVARHQRKFPHLDYGYIQDLADETDDAAAKLAA
jgi:hypothetical protein